MEKLETIRELLESPFSLSDLNLNKDCEGTGPGKPFEKLAAKMQNITVDGGIKKRILCEGHGLALPENALVTINYNAYVEYCSEPFESTRLREQPFSFRLGGDPTTATLSIAVQTMKLNEESQFLIEPIYTFGARGCLKCMPVNCKILFEIAVKNVELADAPAVKNPSRDFGEAYKSAHVLSAKAKELCDKQLYAQAVKEYNAAVAKLEGCEATDQKDETKQQLLLLRLLTNLVTLYTKLEKPRIACTNCNKVYNICKKRSLQIPLKVLFNHARCLILLADYNWAERKLLEAKNAEPHNEAVLTELRKLRDMRKEARRKQTAAKKSLGGDSEVTKEFRESIMQFCKDLRDDDQRMHYNLPDGLTKKELAFCEKEVRKYGLQFKHCNLTGIDKYLIVKNAGHAK